MDITKKIWVYIKKNGLQDGRTILASKDAKLSAFLGKKDVQMFAIAKAVSNHLA
jgi:chromatin remodeling complex protein RSC6